MLTSKLFPKQQEGCTFGPASAWADTKKSENSANNDTIDENHSDVDG